MYWRLPIIAALAGFILCSTAHATVVTSTFGFGPGGNCSTSSTVNPTQVTNGTSFTGSAGGTITAYAYQANSSGVLGTPYSRQGYSFEEMI